MCVVFSSSWRLSLKPPGPVLLDTEDLQDTHDEAYDTHEGQETPESNLRRSPCGRVGVLDHGNEDVGQHDRTEGNADDSTNEASHFVNSHSNKDLPPMIVFIMASLFYAVSSPPRTVPRITNSLSINDSQAF